VYLEYLLIIGLFFFCVGFVGTLLSLGRSSRFLSRWGRYFPLITMSGSIISLIGFSLYWRRPQGFVGVIVLLLLAGLAFVITHCGIGEEKPRA